MSIIVNVPNIWFALVNSAQTSPQLTDIDMNTVCYFCACACTHMNSINIILLLNINLDPKVQATFLQSTTLEAVMMEREN